VGANKDRAEIKVETKNSSSPIGTIVGILAFLILFFYVLDWSFINGAIKEYPIWCPKDFTEKNGCMTQRNTTYYPSKRKQTVKTKDDFGIETLTKCSVINRKNWQCTFNDGSGNFGFNSGKFHSDLWLDWEDSDVEAMLDKSLEHQYVSSVRYLLEFWNLI